jgi:hypothetical protein
MWLKQQPSPYRVALEGCGSTQIPHSIQPAIHPTSGRETLK